MVVAAGAAHRNPHEYRARQVRRICETFIVQLLAVHVGLVDLRAQRVDPRTQLGFQMLQFSGGNQEGAVEGKIVRPSSSPATCSCTKRS